MLVTALVTPFREGGNGSGAVDLGTYRELVSFQLEHGVDQVLVAGTTGEGAALTYDERMALLDAALEVARPGQVMLSIGGGRLEQVVGRGRAALVRGVRDLLLADCPYSGASSHALRTQWHGPAAAALPESRLFPYAVPGRTGTEMLPDDLARLAADHPNVVGVKDATGRLARMARVRRLCGDDFVLLCGDDHLLRDATLDPNIRADGACSFSANLAPALVGRLADAGASGDAVAARTLHEQLHLLAGLVSVTTDESVDLPVGVPGAVPGAVTGAVTGEARGEQVDVPQRARNPVPVKTALSLLGLIAEEFRAPLAPMETGGVSRVRSALYLTQRRHPEVLEDLAHHFGIDLAAALDLPGAPFEVDFDEAPDREGRRVEQTSA